MRPGSRARSRQAVALSDLPTTALSKDTGPLQAMWALPLVAMIYDNIQVVLRKLLTIFRPRVEWLNIPQGGIVVDADCGPASVTAALARVTGPTTWCCVSTAPRRCHHVRSGPNLGHKSASYTQTRNGFRYATRQSMPRSLWLCCSWYPTRRGRWARWRGCCALGRATGRGDFSGCWKRPASFHAARAWWASPARRMLRAACSSACAR